MSEPSRTAFLNDASSLTASLVRSARCAAMDVPLTSSLVFLCLSFGRHSELDQCMVLVFKSPLCVRRCHLASVKPLSMHGQCFQVNPLSLTLPSRLREASGPLWLERSRRGKPHQEVAPTTTNTKLRASALVALLCARPLSLSTNLHSDATRSFVR